MWLSRLLVVLIVLALSSAAEAQQPTRTPRVAYLTGTPLSAMTDRTEGIPAGAARAWSRGGKKHCDRVAISRGKTRSYAHACS